MENEFEERYGVVLLDTETGEEAKKLEPAVSGARWQKIVAPRLSEILDSTGSKKAKFIGYLINKKTRDNLIYGTYAEMAKNSGVSIDVVKRLFPVLLKGGFIKRVNHCEYMLDPTMIRPGERWRGGVMVSLWKDLG